MIMDSNSGIGGVGVGGTRNTRASRGEFGADRDRMCMDRSRIDIRTKPNMLASAHLKVRKWRKVIVKVGNLIIPKYVSDQPVSNELRERQLALRKEVKQQEKETNKLIKDLNDKTDRWKK